MIVYNANIRPVSVRLMKRVVHSYYGKEYHELPHFSDLGVAYKRAMQQLQQGA